MLTQLKVYLIRSEKKLKDVQVFFTFKKNVKLKTEGKNIRLFELNPKLSQDFFGFVFCYYAFIYFVTCFKKSRRKGYQRGRKYYRFFVFSPFSVYYIRTTQISFTQ